MARKTVLVVGGAGFIGSHVNIMLHRCGYDTVVFDNLSTGCHHAVSQGTFIHGDLSNINDINKVFQDKTIDAVMHFAAYIDAGESCHKPLYYYENNVANTLNLLKVMLEHHVKVMIFSSSAAIFGNPKKQPITEDHDHQPISPYGHTKLMVEQILQDIEVSTSLRSCCLRYFNAAGGDPLKELKNYKIREHNLIPVALRSIFNGEAITIFGTDYSTSDGTCIRDYVHVHDVGQAHINAMEQLFQGAPSEHYNLGNGQGYTVKQVINAIEEVTGKAINVIEGPRRAGDPPALVADAAKAIHQLGWRPQYTDLKTIIEHAWQALN